MYASRTTQFLVGIFGLIGIAALALLSLRLGRVELFPSPGYTIYANFDNISGLKTGDLVEIAGVKVGKVTGISLVENRARVSIYTNQGVQIDTDAIAAVKTSGIIGDKYVSIALGPGERMLKAGDTLRQTQSAFVLEDAIGQLINSNSSGGSGSGGGAARPGGADSSNSNRKDCDCAGQVKK
jgi:phospholipid/cholesterol/gamma-HCH transport system substrate-binding protein